MRFFLLLAALLNLWASPLRAADYPPTDHLVTGPSRYIVDGDTLDVGKTRIRLWGINTPERKEPGYEDAKEFLRKLTENATLNCAAFYYDKWKRTVASCEIDGQDIGRMMVLSGMAQDYTKYSNGFYQKDEAKARLDKVGLWKAIP